MTFPRSTGQAEKRIEKYVKTSEYIYIYITLVKRAPATNLLVSQRRSQNAENVTHIKGGLLDQAVILFN